VKSILISGATLKKATSPETKCSSHLQLNSVHGHRNSMQFILISVATAKQGKGNSPRRSRGGGLSITLIATATFLCNATPPQPLLRFSYFKLHQVHATEKVFHTRVRRQWLHPVQRYLGKTTWPITTLLRLARPYFELLMLNSWCSTPRTLYPFAATHPFRTQLQPHAHLSHKQHYK